MLRRDITLGVIAGILIGIGGSVYLACDNKYVGAVLFSVALLCICMRGFALFTGKVGFLVASHGKADVSATLLSLPGNLIGTFIAGIAVRFALPHLARRRSLCVRESLPRPHRKRLSAPCSAEFSCISPL